MAESDVSSGLCARSQRFSASKFSPPTVSRTFVHRPRLLEELDKGQLRRLSLVIGSPGAGKTALLADWALPRPERPCAWLNCDVADADPVRFFAGIIEALRRASRRRGVGEDALQLLSLDGEVSGDVVSALADDLEELGEVTVLVVDDFHLTGDRGADALELLLAYRPLSFQVVVATPLTRAFGLAGCELTRSCWSFETATCRFRLTRPGSCWPSSMSSWTIKLFPLSSDGARAGPQGCRWRPSLSINPTSRPTLLSE